jgi:hypothetical protein
LGSLIANWAAEPDFGPVFEPDFGFREELIKRQLAGKPAHLCKRGFTRKIACSPLLRGN